MVHGQTRGGGRILPGRAGHPAGDGDHPQQSRCRAHPREPAGRGDRAFSAGDRPRPRGRAPAVGILPSLYGTWAVTDEAIRELPEALRLNPRSPILLTLSGKVHGSQRQARRSPRPYTDRPSRSIRTSRRRKEHCASLLRRRGSRGRGARSPGKRRSTQAPPDHRRVVRIRRILPVPRKGGGLSRRSPGLAREVR